jgi:hypothetical protein
MGWPGILPPRCLIFQYGDVPVAVMVRQGRRRRVERPREPASATLDRARFSHRSCGGRSAFQDLGARGGALSGEASLLDRAQARGSAAPGRAAGSFPAAADRAAGLRGDLADSSVGRRGQGADRLLGIGSARSCRRHRQPPVGAPGAAPLADGAGVRGAGAASGAMRARARFQLRPGAHPPSTHALGKLLDAWHDQPQLLPALSTAGGGALSHDPRARPHPAHEPLDGWRRVPDWVFADEAA